MGAIRRRRLLTFALETKFPQLTHCIHYFVSRNGRVYMYGKFNGQNDGQTVSYGFLEFAPCPFGGRWSWLAWDQLDPGLLGLSSDII